MRKIAAVLLIAMVTVLTGKAAHAVPLPITGGFIDVRFSGDSFARFGGDGFSVEIGATIPFVGPGTLNLGGELFFGFVQVVVGNETCSFPTLEPSFTCGFITLNHPPLPTGSQTSFSAPFTASGHLNVGGGFDFVGQGIVVSDFRCPGVFPEFCTVIGYGFSVPVTEPPSLLLLVAGALAIAGLTIVRNSRNSPSR
jgi:hypothetical protein